MRLNGRNGREAGPCRAFLRVRIWESPMNLSASDWGRERPCSQKT
jgi:hypothetical protein